MLSSVCCDGVTLEKEPVCLEKGPGSDLQAGMKDGANAQRNPGVKLLC